MRTLLNIIWFVLSGLWLALGYAVAGVIACLLVITIPFGLQAFKLAGYSLWPFGRAVVRNPSVGGASAVGNLLWLVLFGWWLALSHIVAAFFCAITIIGLPLAVANIKLVPVALWPFGRDVVDARRVGVLPASGVAIAPPGAR
jgi:uncharacterized membrane protein YccF (DUF307 family)